MLPPNHGPQIKPRHRKTVGADHNEKYLMWCKTDLSEVEIMAPYDLFSPQYQSKSPQMYSAGRYLLSDWVKQRSELTSDGFGRLTVGSPKPTLDLSGNGRSRGPKPPFGAFAPMTAFQEGYHLTEIGEPAVFATSLEANESDLGLSIRHLN